LELFSIPEDEVMQELRYYNKGVNGSASVYTLKGVNGSAAVYTLNHNLGGKWLFLSKVTTDRITIMFFDDPTCCSIFTLSTTGTIYFAQ
jgi:hypothetical protein